MDRHRKFYGGGALHVYFLLAPPRKFLSPFDQEQAGWIHRFSNLYRSMISLRNDIGEIETNVSIYDV